MLTDEERRNLDTVERWAIDYNQDGAHCVRTHYVEDLVVQVPGIFIERGMETAVAIEEVVQEQSPGRHLELSRVLPSGSSVTLQGAIHYPRPDRTYTFDFLCIVDFRDGKIATETWSMDVLSIMRVGALAIPPEFLDRYDIGLLDPNGFLSAPAS
jgi:hypothetical protein